jgi:CRP-like cAMP-binding protein
MLLKSGSRVAECYRRAADAREKSRRATRSADCVFFARMEQKWLRLAESYTCGERTRFIDTQQKDTAAPLTNRLLAGMSSAALTLLEPIKRVRLAQGAVLWNAGKSVDRAYFPHTGAISLIVMTEDGGGVEVGLVAAGGAFGLNPNIARRTLSRAAVRIGGVFSIVSAERIAHAADQSAEIRALIADQIEAQLAQARQIAACNGLHNTRARVCRLLLQYRDCVEQDVLPLTQDELSQALGVYRTTVTAVTESLKEAKLIDYKRGKIIVRDHAGLTALACECYRLLRQESGRSLGWSAMGRSLKNPRVRALEPN